MRLTKIWAHSNNATITDRASLFVSWEGMLGQSDCEISFEVTIPAGEIGRRPHYQTFTLTLNEAKDMHMKVGRLLSHYRRLKP